MPSYSEILDARAAQPSASGATTPQRLAAMLRESQRGAVVLTELLDSPAWDVFRSNLAGHLQSAYTERTLLREQIEAGQVVGG